MRHRAVRRESVVNKQNIADTFVIVGLVLAAVILVNLWTYDNEHNALATQLRLYESNQIALESLPYQFGNAIQAADNEKAVERSRELVLRYRRAIRSARELRQSSWHGNLTAVEKDLVRLNRMRLAEALAYQRSAMKKNSRAAIAGELLRTEDWEIKSSRLQESLVTGLKDTAPWKPTLPRIAIPRLGSIL